MDFKHQEYIKYLSTLFKMKSFTNVNKILHILKYLLITYLDIEECNYYVSYDETSKNIYNETYNIYDNIIVVSYVYNMEDFQKLGKLVGNHFGMIYYIENEMFYEYDITDLYNELSLNQVQSIKFIIKHINN